MEALGQQSTALSILMEAAAQLLPASQQAIMVAPYRPGSPLLQVASAMELEGLPIMSGAALPVTPACDACLWQPAGCSVATSSAYSACCLRMWAQAHSSYGNYSKMLLKC